MHPQSLPQPLFLLPSVPPTPSFLIARPISLPSIYLRSLSLFPLLLPLSLLYPSYTRQCLIHPSLTRPCTLFIDYPPLFSRDWHSFFISSSSVVFFLFAVPLPPPVFQHDLSYPILISFLPSLFVLSPVFSYLPTYPFPLSLFSFFCI